MDDGSVRTPHPIQEGELFGSEVNAGNGKRYTYAGHFLGDGTIVYRASISDANGEYRGDVGGTFTHAPDATGGSARAQVEALLCSAIRGGIGYRP